MVFKGFVNAVLKPDIMIELRTPPVYVASFKQLGLARPAVQAANIT